MLEFVEISGLMQGAFLGLFLISIFSILGLLLMSLPQMLLNRDKRAAKIFALNAVFSLLAVVGLISVGDNIYEKVIENNKRAIEHIETKYGVDVLGSRVLIEQNLRLSNDPISATDTDGNRIQVTLEFTDESKTDILAFSSGAEMPRVNQDKLTK